MKKVLILITFIVLAISVKAQLPNQVGQGSESMEWYQKGITGGDLGIRWRLSFGDTTAANNYRGGILKNIAGFTIRTVDDLWSRSNDLQKWNKINGTGGGSDSISVLSTVTQISSLSRANINQLVVIDTIRGGTFDPYTGTGAADDGLIFSDALARKWIRTGVDAVNIDWFGAVKNGADTRQIILDAIASAKLHLPKIKIYVPGSATNDYYNVSDSIVIDDLVEIYGDGYISKLKFAPHKKGLIFTYPFTSYTRLHDIAILGEAATGINGDSSLWNDNAHGIDVKTPVEFNNVWVRYFDGNGINLENDLTVPSPGNSSTSSFINCHIYNNLMHGIFAKGGDANAANIQRCDIVSNGGVAIYDSSFFGNQTLGNHAASNGSPELRYQRGLVSYGGTVYASIVDSNINHTPPNTAYWQDVGTYWLPFTYVRPYDAARYYHTVGSYIFDGLNQYSVAVGNYAEEDQAPGYVAQGVLNLGGGGFKSRGVYPTTLFAQAGKIVSKAFLKGEHGIGSKWLYGGDMGDIIDNYTAIPTYSGFIVGSSDKHGLLDFWDNYINIGQYYTDANNLNLYTFASKGFRVYTNNSGTTSRLSVTPSGSIGIGIDNPVALLHLAAGTATANTAPIKLNTGTALTTPEDGAIEYHGSHIYFTIGSTRYQLDQQAGTNLGNSNLTQTGGNRSYSGDNQNLSFNGGGATTEFNVEYGSVILTGLNSGINIQGDSILIVPEGGKIYIDSLPPSTDVIDSVVVRTPTGQLKQRAQSDIGGSGTYTPTLTNVANISASTAYSCQWSRSGSVITVSGEVDIDPTTTLTLTQLGISLPVASALANANELAGTSADDLNTAARVAGDATNNRAEIRMTPVDVTNRRFSFTFTYRVL